MVENMHMIFEKATKLGVVAYTHNPNSQEAETGGWSQISSQPELKKKKNLKNKQINKINERINKENLKLKSQNTGKSHIFNLENIL